jgi:hypothetical protein
MDVRKSRIARAAALTMVVALPLLGMGGIASAKPTAARCAAHPNAKKCQTAGGGASGGASGGPSSPQIKVTVSPNPLVETGQSEVHGVVEVEALPAYAGDNVTLQSSQLQASCALMQFAVNRGSSTPGFFGNNITVALDNDGNATVALFGKDCAPGTSVIEADLDVAPFVTALTTLTTLPPQVTPEGLTGSPNPEVETGDTGSSGDSDVMAVFYVETNPVYAEQNAFISSPELESRCIRGWWWQGENGGSVSSENSGTIDPNNPVSQLDDDGNAVFVFFGASCATGDSQVIAEVTAGTHPTYVLDYTIDPPAPTI